MIVLSHGDCREIIPDMLLHTRNPIIVTDPPFNIGYRYNTYRDRMDEDEYYHMLGGVLAYCPSVVIHYPESLYRLAREMDTSPVKVVSWVYNSNTARQHRDIAFFGVKPDFAKVKQPYKNPSDKRIKAQIAKGKTGANIYDWWDINQVKNVSKVKTKHPCQMPLEVMRRIIGILPDDVTIVDPFMGSGTTGVACAELGRDFVGIELDKGYCEIARARIMEVLPDGKSEM